MKKVIVNVVLVLAFCAGLAVSMFAPWWAVWFICFPVMYGSVIGLIKFNQKNWIRYYGC